MSTTATLDSATVSLEAGSEAFVPLHIRNDGDIVEEYRFQVIGPSGTWAEVAPEAISLYPGEDATASVEFRPPRSAIVPAGEIKYGVRVLPTEHPEEAVVPEGTVNVLPFYETTAELMPRTSRGRRGARHRLAVDNRGNVPVTVTLAASDPGEMLDLSLRAPALTVEPGTAQFTDVRVRPLKSLWRGASATHTFSVSVMPLDGPPVVLDGTHLQEPVLPPWFFKALVAALLLAVALVSLWLFVVRPAVESTAKAAVQESVAKANENAAGAETNAAQSSTGAVQAGVAATAAKDAADAAAAAAKKAEDLVGTPNMPEIVTSVAERLEVVAAPGAAGVTPYVFDAAEGTLQLTDLVLNNPQGDFGRLSLQLDGVVLLDMALENFRDIDYHFLTPIRVSAGQELNLAMTCNRVGEPPDQTPPTQCKSAALLGGKFSVPNPATPPQ